MKLKHIAAAAVFCATAFCGNAQQSMDNPITKAMMEVYDQELAANPNNYEVLYRRGTEYYRHNQYLRALSDIDGALKNAPANNKDFLAATYQLRGEIYQMLDKYSEALSDFKNAYSNDPTSFLSLYQIANCEYELGDYAAAKADYMRMRAINNRSAEALTGLARVAVKENNLGMAQQYMDDAVNMMPADPDVYIRRASVREMLGNNSGAVDDLIMSISINANGRAFQDLTNLANEDYPAVITGLGNAISQAPEQGMFYYIRAMIAQAHYHYPAAIADFTKIIDTNMYNYAGIYNSLAECNLALCQYEEALDNVNRAISMVTKEEDDTPYYLTLARVQHAQGETKEALENIAKVLLSNPSNPEALTEKALCLYDEKKFDEASTIFGEMIMDDPENPMNYMMQAWVLNDGLDQSPKALQVYRRMLEMLDARTTEETEEIDISEEGKLQARAQKSAKSLKGFALLFTDSKYDAIEWAEDLLKVKDTDGSLNYTAACLYAQAGDNENALACADRAMKMGYASTYNWTVNNTARVNVAPLRKGTALTELMAKYAYIFD